MADKFLHGSTRVDHNFIVASMVSRRAGRGCSQLACGTGAMLVGCAALYVAGGLDSAVPGPAWHAGARSLVRA